MIRPVEYQAISLQLMLYGNCIPDLKKHYVLYLFVINAIILYKLVSVRSLDTWRFLPYSITWGGYNLVAHAQWLN